MGLAEVAKDVLDASYITLKSCLIAASIFSDIRCSRYKAPSALRAEWIPT